MLRGVCCVFLAEVIAAAVGLKKVSGCQLNFIISFSVVQAR